MQVDLHELPADQQELRGSLVNGYGGFSEDVRQALAQARREAIGFGHEYVGPEHVLLGIIANPENIAVSLLASHDVKPETIRDRITSIIRRGNAAERPDLPYTSRAKRIIELAMSEARELDAGVINTGHFFLGVMREEKGIGANVLTELGFTLDPVRIGLVAMMRAGRSEIQISPGQAPPARPSIEMKPSQAAAMLTAMLHSPRVATVFEKHSVDVRAVIRDLHDDPPNA